jgi:hypothetical protein
MLSGVPTIPSACPTGPSSTWYGSTPANFFQVKVTDASGQSAIQQFCLGTFYPIPQVSSATPSPITADGMSHTLTVSGLNFRPNSEVLITGGAQLSAQFVDSNHLAITLLPSPNALFVVNETNSSQVNLGDGARNVWVVQPVAGFSNQNVTFTIADPPPTITSVTAVLNNSNSPCTTNLLCQLVITGTGLVFDTQYAIANPGTTLQLADSPNTVLPWNTVTTTSFSLSSTGTYNVTVSNPNQAGGGTATAQGQFTLSQ